MAFDEPDKKASEKKKDKESPPTKVRCQLGSSGIFFCQDLYEIYMTHVDYSRYISFIFVFSSPEPKVICELFCLEGTGDDVIYQIRIIQYGVLPY